LEAALAAARETVKLNEPGAAFPLELIEAASERADGLETALDGAVVVDDKEFGQRLVVRGDAAAALVLGQAGIREGQRIEAAGENTVQKLQAQIQELTEKQTEAEQQLRDIFETLKRSKAAAASAEQKVMETSEALQASTAALRNAEDQYGRLKKEIA